MVVVCLEDWEALGHNVPTDGDQAKDWGNEQSNKILERNHVGLYWQESTSKLVL